MFARHNFVQRAEQVLIAAMVLGIVLITQRYSVAVYRWGISILVISTFLQIAVGNLPRSASFARTVLLTLVILASVAAVFAIGIWLVPVLSQMGRR